MRLDLPLATSAPSAARTPSAGASVPGLRVLVVDDHRASGDVIERLLDEESAALGELEVLVGKPIRLQTEALYLQDQYDVVLM